jgi:hypothetical protein
LGSCCSSLKTFFLYPILVTVCFNMEHWCFILKTKLAILSPSPPLFIFKNYTISYHSIIDHGHLST